MGITIVQKSDLTVRKRNPRIALVLAGGAISGGGFKLGGLKAFDDFLVNRKTTDFDIYVGLSAGAFLAAPLASGVTPPEMLRSLEGSSEEFTQFGAFDFYQPNYPEFVERPIRYCSISPRSFPARSSISSRKSPALAESIAEPMREFVRAAVARATPPRCCVPIGQALLDGRPFPFPLDYLPSGLFDNATIEHYLRDNLERRHMPNSFKALFQARKKELYIVAMNLDSAERVVFGHDEDSSLSISESVQASTALPGLLPAGAHPRHRLRRRRRAPHREHRRRDRPRRRPGHLLQPVPSVLEPRRPEVRSAEGRLRRRGRAARRPRHADHPESGAADAAALAPAARPPAVSGRSRTSRATSS